jgi:hypothetical protein
MSIAISTFEPDTIIAGDTVEWTQSISDYPATDGWTLKYSFQLIGSTEDPITFEASASGRDYSVSITPAVSAEWASGNYIWTAFVDDGTDRHRVGTGTVSVLPNPEMAAGGTHATRTLALLELAIEGRIPAGLEQTTIDGQSILRITMPDLVLLRNKYASEVRAEQDRARVASGQASRRTMYARFRRVI